MATNQQIEQAVKAVHDQKTFIQILLKDTLDWQVQDEAEGIDDISYDWSPEEIKAKGLSEKLKDGTIRQIQPLHENPWGIFLLEFTYPDAFTTGRGFTRPLRELLRGLVSRRKSANLPVFQRDNLLFICTHEYKYFRFACFQPPAGESKTPPLAIFGWDENDTALRTLCEYNLKALTGSNANGEWIHAFDVKKLTVEFYKEIANWYFWAVKNVHFPSDPKIKSLEENNSINVIRLLTRLIFVWFLRAKNLVSDDLFDEQQVAELLNKFDPLSNKESNYYKAILQNLFFATLNQKMNSEKEPNNRRFRSDDRGFKDRSDDYAVTNLYRHKNLFKSQDAALAAFASIPFLNGGLFDCLDKQDEENPKKIIRIDGFSDVPQNQPIVPEILFFSPERQVDLSQEYGNAKRRAEKVTGLLRILKRYKFTVMESTPVEQEIALDPELLGRIFENLLAAYNPETGTTARKATGSFYTPREIVNYMVDESLIAYLETKLLGGDSTDESARSELNNRLRHLFAYSDEKHNLSKVEVNSIIESLSDLKALDPACGSGAFPMGILLKAVHLLRQLDPDNSRWRALQKKRAIEETEEAYRMGNKDERDARLLEINEAFENNLSDYGRKLYLIENCIYGVDIQPIAVQIAKLRFFISLLIDQQQNDERENRGVLSLPNLETKFVAANTLISLETKGQQIIKSQKVIGLEKDLKKVRHDHFNAKDRKTKLRLVARDKELRCKVADELKGTVGLPETTADKLAKWNPYDQNASAGFFDADWMFAVSKGFDIVIGNPPYNAAIPKNDLATIRSCLYSYRNSNSAILFIDISIHHLAKQNGVTTLIVPKSLLYVENWSDVATDLISYTTALVDVETAFKNVLLEQVVFVYTHYKTIRYRAIKYNSASESFSEINYINKSLFYKFGTWLCDVSKRELDFISKYVDELVFLSTISTTKRGLTIQKLLRANGDVPVIGGKNITSFCIRGTKGFVRKTNLDKYSKRLVHFSNPKIISQRIVAHVQNPKPHLIIMSALDKSGDVLSVDTVENTVISNDKYDPRFVLAILNSRFISWFAYRFIFASAIRTMDLDNYYIGKIFFPKVSLETQSPFISLVEKITESIQIGSFEKSNELIGKLNHLVYSLYDLTPDEIRIVEESTLSTTT